MLDETLIDVSEVDKALKESSCHGEKVFRRPLHETHETIDHDSVLSSNVSSSHSRDSVSSSTSASALATGLRRRRWRQRSINHMAATTLQQQQQPARLRTPRRWLIPSDHPLKLAWDLTTFLLSLANAYATHMAIRDRDFHSALLIRFCEVWFLLDIMLNFVTEYRLDGRRLTSPQAVWARYLTTWFVVDLVSLLPGEALYVQPIFEQQKRRNIIVKTFFRSKAVLRVTRVLRGRHVRWFGQVAKQTSRAGVGARSLLHWMIKYLPKYWLVWRNMKAVVAVRLLRQVHWVRKLLAHTFWRHQLELPEELDDDDESEQEESSLDEEEDDTIDDDEDDSILDDLLFDTDYTDRNWSYESDRASDGARDDWEVVDDGDPY